MTSPFRATPYPVVAALALACVREKGPTIEEEFAEQCLQTFDCLVGDCSEELANYEPLLEDAIATHEACRAACAGDMACEDSCDSELGTTLMESIAPLRACESGCTEPDDAYEVGSWVNPCQSFEDVAPTDQAICPVALGMLAFERTISPSVHPDPAGDLCVAENFSAP